MASAYHVGAAVLVHVARRRRLDSDLDERSFIQEFVENYFVVHDLWAGIRMLYFVCLVLVGSVHVLVFRTFLKYR